MDKLIIIDKKIDWEFKIKSFKKIDSYYSYEYGNLFAKIEMGRLFAAYFEDENTKIFYPFIKRMIPDIDEELFDIVTPYGYGGPLIEGDINKAFEFYNLFSDYCIGSNIITETIRYHPLYQNQEWFMNVLENRYVRKTTAVNLTNRLEEIRNNYTSMNKRNILKAKKNGLICFEAEKSEQNIKIFMDLYRETMDRNNAANFYYFDETYFNEQVKDTLISETYLLFTKWNQEIIAGVLIIVGKEFSHYHLGASKTEYLDLKPNNLLFDYMVEFCKSKGSELLHLGGGYQEGDGLFRFKTSFTNNYNFQYYIGKKIYDSKKYHEMVKEISREFEVNESYFPIYRGKRKRKLKIEG